LFKAIKQPVVLGYIIAGLIAGPHLNLFHVTDIQNIKTWADIGVIFLLFSLGLDFSFKKLFNIGGTAFITAITVVIAMLTLGYLTGKLMGWSHMNSLFLGGMLSMSSTTIIIKSFDDMGLRNQLFAGLVIGVLIVEDLVAVIMMVLLSTIAASTEFSGTELLFNIIRLFIFVIIWFVGGIFVIPTLLKKTKKWMNDETMLVVALALCLGMVLLATKIGFSAALGAFVMGSLLAETLEAEKIEHLTKPVKDFFGAIFFVSVGMMIDPTGLGQYWLPILLITFVVVFGQITFGTIGMILSGQPFKVAIQSGFSLAQVGEFAFIIATLR
jgi:CPA2 family monovalent cation:H+ antiporter-2